MASSVLEISEQRRAEKLSASLLQPSLFEPIRPNWRQFLRRLLRNHLKEAAAIIYPNTDPDRALINLCQILDDDGERKRHFDVEWLRKLYALGPEFREAIVRYIAEDNGFEAHKLPDPVRTEEQIAALKTSVKAMTETLAEIADQLDRIEKTKP